MFKMFLLLRAFVLSSLAGPLLLVAAQYDQDCKIDTSEPTYEPPSKNGAAPVINTEDFQVQVISSSDPANPSATLQQQRVMCAPRCLKDATMSCPVAPVSRIIGNLNEKLFCSIFKRLKDTS